MPDHTLGDAPIQAEYRERMQALSRALDETLNGELRGPKRKVGSVLLVYPFGEVADARCNFISNGADRRDIVALLKEMIARFEAPTPRDQDRRPA